MPLNARQLEVFRTVMRCGTLTSAAKALNVSQPALSQILLHAEDALGFKLFQRLKGRLVPTPEAEQLFPETDRVFRAFEDLQRFAGDLRHGKGGLVRLAASAPPALSLVPRALKAFRAACPGVRLRSYVVPVATIVEMLERGAADLGVAMNDERHPLIDTELIGRSEVVCVLRADHRLAAADVVGIADLPGETLISYRADSLPGMLLDRAFAGEGSRLRPDVEIDVSMIALSFVQQGIGIALVDGLLPWESFPGLVARRFRPTVTLPLCLLTSSERPLSRNQEMLRRQLRAAVRSHAADAMSQGVLTAV
jgi:DNA-binding transcriptional LysR family regulator